MEAIKKYFTDLEYNQEQQLAMLQRLYKEWNDKINVISRKDIDNLYIHHVLHSMAIAKIIKFTNNSKIIDVGTGGGLPGIPLAILFPKCHFTLIDAIEKKVKVANEIAKSLNLNNVECKQIRIEKVKEKYDFIVSRAVMRFDKFYSLSIKCVSKYNKNSLSNGILYLKGGEFDDEIKTIISKIETYNISDFFEESFFETKKIIHCKI